MFEIQGAATALFGFIGGTSIISGVILRRFAALEKKLDTQEEARIEESVITFTVLKAIGHLAEATAIAQQKGYTNGQMETALKYYTESKDQLNNYLMRRSAERAHIRA